jgi:hypothetical protein
MQDKSFRVNVRFDEETYLKLRKIADRKGLSMSATIRSQMMKWLRNWEPKA